MERRFRSWILPIAAGDDHDGTDPEDLAIYLESLDRYRRWFLRETPAEYLRRLDAILDMLDEDLAALSRLMSIPQDQFLGNSGYASQALWHFFHSLVTFLELSKWLLARETPRKARPRSFSEAFRWLAECGVLPPEKVDAYRDLCRWRNRLAHSLDQPPSPAEVHAMIGRWLPELQETALHLRRLGTGKDSQAYF